MNLHDDRLPDPASWTRRQVLQHGVAAVAVAGGMRIGGSPISAQESTALTARPSVPIRGLYGGFPQAIFDRGKTPSDYGVNAIWIGSGGLKTDDIKRAHDLGLKVYAEFNSMHAAEYLKEHPDAAPVGPDGAPSPPPQGWQGVSPFHAGYRRSRMAEFRRVLETFPIDGIWLDYHHAHASWERDEPDLPDTDFCPAALRQFTEATGVKLPQETSAASRLLLGEHREAWTRFRCDVFTDWVREYREILNAVRPGALLGTFHCPWSPEDNGGAIRHKLAIDLAAQAKFLDVFSIMPYHARFGHPRDLEWISRQTVQLGKVLGLKGHPNEPQRIWPIVQLADWGPTVSASDVSRIIDFGTRPPATGVMVFHWSGVSQQWDKVEALGKAYRELNAQS